MPYRKKLWGPDDRLTPEGHELGGRVHKALKEIMREYAEEYSLRDILTVINQELQEIGRHLLEEKGKTDV